MSKGSKIDYDHELSNGWDRLGVMVLTELKRLADGQDQLTEEVTQLRLWQAAHMAVNADHAEQKKSRLAWAAIYVPGFAGLVTAIATIVWLAVG